MFPVAVHVDGFQRVVHPLANLAGGNAQVFRSKSNVFLHHIGNDLVIRILENHANGAPELQQAVFVGRINAVHIDRSARGEQYGVHVLRQGGFARPVVAQHGDKGALLNVQTHPVQYDRGDPLGGGVGEAEVFRLYDSGHSSPSDISKSNAVLYHYIGFSSMKKTIKKLPCGGS